MRNLDKLFVSAALLAGSTFMAAAQAQTAKPAAATASATATTTATATATAADLTEGEVRKVDRVNKKITLKHGEIKNLDMPGMTMVFQVAAPAMLDKLKAGDKVRFRAANADGKITVTEIQSAK